ncbi:unnamed protein product, partial [Medioppia subpectinata]
ILTTNDDKSAVRVQIYYSPLSTNAINLLRAHRDGQAGGIYAMVNAAATAPTTVKYTLDVDFIPWGTATRTVVQNKFAYQCQNNDAECKGTRLHACIARGRISQYTTFNKYTMVMCTTAGTDWATNPLANLETCATSTNQIEGDGPLLTTCAADASVDGNGYLDETMGATIALNHDMTEPVIVINGMVNTAAVANLKNQVCLAIDAANRPATECAGIVDPTPVKSKVSVQVYYTPLAQKSIDFIALNAEGNARGVYGLIKNQLADNAQVKYDINFEYIPWGRATKTRTTDDKVQYTCVEGDTDCKATRLHAINNSVVYFQDILAGTNI